MRQSSSTENAKDTIKKCQKELEKLGKQLKDMQRELDFQVQQYKETFAYLKQTIPDLFR